mmetsp:Transcript_9493/g.20367  ORF Transcript_9493/g.20367 Transcript_9493/m.20367 type:complete len:301 (-) Transcript_9493:24-926(-)
MVSSICGVDFHWYDYRIADLLLLYHWRGYRRWRGRSDFYHGLCFHRSLSLSLSQSLGLHCCRSRSSGRLGLLLLFPLPSLLFFLNLHLLPVNLQALLKVCAAHAFAAGLLELGAPLDAAFRTIRLRRYGSVGRHGRDGSGILNLHLFVLFLRFLLLLDFLFFLHLLFLFWYRRLRIFLALLPMSTAHTLAAGLFELVAFRYRTSPRRLPLRPTPGIPGDLGALGGGRLRQLLLLLLLPRRRRRLRLGESRGGNGGEFGLALPSRLLPRSCHGRRGRGVSPAPETAANAPPVAQDAPPHGR